MTHCPVCGLPMERSEPGEIVCNPLRCPAWVYTHRYSKKKGGWEPILTVVKDSTPEGNA
jgi:uncharacterized Zn finger protein (UPF0148 family)